MAYNKTKQKFVGDKLFIENFSNYVPGVNGELITIFNNLSLYLPSNRIYKLLAQSGSGKTTFLKAITNN